MLRCGGVGGAFTVCVVRGDFARFFLFLFGVRGRGGG